MIRIKRKTKKRIKKIKRKIKKRIKKKQRQLKKVIRELMTMMKKLKVITYIFPASHPAQISFPLIFLLKIPFHNPHFSAILTHSIVPLPAKRRYNHTSKSESQGNFIFFPLSFRNLNIRNMDFGVFANC